MIVAENLQSGLGYIKSVTKVRKKGFVCASAEAAVTAILAQVGAYIDRTLGLIMLTHSEIPDARSFIEDHEPARAFVVEPASTLVQRERPAVMEQLPTLVPYGNKKGKVPLDEGPELDTPLFGVATTPFE
jgi:hypothetical protein